MRRAPVALGVAATAVAALICLPLVYLAIRAGGGGSDAWDVLLRDRTSELIVRTILLVAAVTAASVAVGVPLAWLVTRTDLPGRRVWAVAAALPLVIPSYVAALALLSAFGPGGLVESVPEVDGFTGAFAALTLATYPYVFLLSAAALRQLDVSLEEASRALGRTRGYTFLRVTLPVIRPSVAAGALLVALYTISDFGVVSLMRYDVLTRAVYQQYRSLFDRTPAAVLGLLLVALTVVVLLLEARARGRARVAAAPRGAPRQAAPVALGRWRWPALAACAAVVGAALVLPVAVLAYWAGRGVDGDTFDGVWAAAGNSLLASGLAAAAAIAAALPVAALAVRHPARWTRALERTSYASNALPGIVIALSLVFFAANYASPVYQTLALLVVAYVVRFFPQALAGAHGALLRVDPRLEEAARGLGRTPRAAFASITARLIAPGLLAGATLVFLSAMKELPATLLLRPIGFETLATEVWSATGVGSYSQAAVPALVLIVLAAPVVWLLIARPGASTAPVATEPPE
ncbi:MAG TPA: iron ABC transporter permease [Thermoleophilaceae bacterium]|jgi:iron(III) transport system permease protein